MYLYVILSSVPGSSFSQIKATLSGSFATCTSKQFTVNHCKRKLLLCILFTIKKVFLYAFTKQHVKMFVLPSHSS